MTYAAEANPLIPVPPPGEDELPSSDGEPMDTEKHKKQMNVLTESLELEWDARADFYVGGNMCLYFSELQTKKNDFRGPDVFVVLDTVRRVRKSWVVWQEERTPDVVIELVSPTTETVDRGEKMRIYSKVLRVPEYYLHDPETEVLEGYKLDLATSSYSPMVREPNGDFVSARLGLRLGVRPGRYQGVEGNWLRWIDAGGRVLPTGEEKARAAEEKASAAEEKASAAEEKAQDLASKLAEYERRFGKLEDGSAGR
jgi:Uma2 family endonuclease